MGNGIKILRSLVVGGGRKRERKRERERVVRHTDRDQGRGGGGDRDRDREGGSLEMFMKSISCFRGPLIKTKFACVFVVFCLMG